MYSYMLSITYYHIGNTNDVYEYFLDFVYFVKVKKDKKQEENSKMILSPLFFERYKKNNL